MKVFRIGFIIGQGEKAYCVVPKIVKGKSHRCSNGNHEMDTYSENLVAGSGSSILYQKFLAQHGSYSKLEFMILPSTMHNPELTPDHLPIQGCEDLLACILSIVQYADGEEDALVLVPCAPNPQESIEAKKQRVQDVWAVAGKVNAFAVVLPQEEADFLPSISCKEPLRPEVFKKIEQVYTATKSPVIVVNESSVFLMQCQAFLLHLLAIAEDIFVKIAELLDKSACSFLKKLEELEISKNLQSSHENTTDQQQLGTWLQSFLNLQKLQALCGSKSIKEKLANQSDLATRCADALMNLLYFLPRLEKLKKQASDIHPEGLHAAEAFALFGAIKQFFFSLSEAISDAKQEKILALSKVNDILNVHRLAIQFNGNPLLELAKALGMHGASCGHQTLHQCLVSSQIPIEFSILPEGCFQSLLAFSKKHADEEIAMDVLENLDLTSYQASKAKTDTLNDPARAYFCKILRHKQYKHKPEDIEKLRLHIHIFGKSSNLDSKKSFLDNFFEAMMPLVVFFLREIRHFSNSKIAKEMQCALNIVEHTGSQKLYEASGTRGFLDAFIVCFLHEKYHISNAQIAAALHLRLDDVEQILKQPFCFSTQELKQLAVIYFRHKQYSHAQIEALTTVVERTQFDWWTTKFLSRLRQLLNTIFEEGDTHDAKDIPHGSK